MTEKTWIEEASEELADFDRAMSGQPITQERLDEIHRAQLAAQDARETPETLATIQEARRRMKTLTERWDREGFMTGDAESDTF